MTAKRAQLSWFVAMGIIFLVILAIVSWLAYSTQLAAKKPSQTLSGEASIEQVKDYLQSCEQGIAEEAFIVIGNKGVEELPSLEDMAKEAAEYIDSNLTLICDAEIVTKKEVKTSRPKTSISFNDKETIIETEWPVTVTIGEDQHSITELKTSIPLRMKLIHEAVKKDLKNTGTDLNYLESLDKMDLKKIKSENKIINILIDHKSKVKNKPYKFFYVENL